MSQGTPKQRTLYVELIDPRGFRHHVLYDGGAIHGHENIAHVYEDEAERERDRRELLARMPAAEVGTYRGYIWKHLSHLALAAALTACGNTESSTDHVASPPHGPVPIQSPVPTPAPAPPVTNPTPTCDETRLAARDLAGNCRATPQPTMGAVEVAE